MRNAPYLINEINHENAALEADFCCTCGNHTFRISHSGTFHKGIFGGISIDKKKNQLIIKCRCSECAREYVLFDSTIDGAKPKGTPIYEFNPLEIKGESVFEINLAYNYLEENFKTDKFEMFFLNVKISGSDKYITICEM